MQKEEIMKHLRLIPVLCLCIFALMVMPVQAASSKSGVYAGLKFVDSIQTVWLSDISKNQNTIGGAVFFGYDFYPRMQLPIRAEIEYTLRSNLYDDRNYDNNDVNFGNSAKMDYMFNAQTLLANIYFDFHNSSAFTPYVGAGLGLGFVNEFVNVDSNFMDADFGNERTSESLENYTTTFAWQVGAGVAYAFNDTVSADLGYRYMNFGMTTYEGFNENTYASAHELSLGMRFNF